MENLKSAFERFFRLFHKFCIQPDLDTLFNLMNSIHSLNDRLNNAASQNFFKSREFISIKALRNLFHHQDELLNELRIIPADRLPPITTDLLFLCLVPAHLVEASFEHIPKKYRDEQKAADKLLFLYEKCYAGCGRLLKHHLEEDEIPDSQMPFPDRYSIKRHILQDNLYGGGQK